MERCRPRVAEERERPGSTVCGRREWVECVRRVGGEGERRGERRQRRRWALLDRVPRIREEWRVAGWGAWGVERPRIKVKWLPGSVGPKERLRGDVLVDWRVGVCAERRGESRGGRRRREGTADWRCWHLDLSKGKFWGCGRSSNCLGRQQGRHGVVQDSAGKNNNQLTRSLQHREALLRRPL